MFTKKNAKIAGLYVMVALLSAMTASPASAKSRRLSPVSDCNGEIDLDHDCFGNSLGYFFALDYCSYTCGIPNDSYFANTEIDTINVHMYNSSSSDRVWARPCVADYNSNDTYCLTYQETYTAGEVTLSFNSANMFSGYGGHATFVYGSIDYYDKIRAVYVYGN